MPAAAYPREPNFDAFEEARFRDEEMARFDTAPIVELCTIPLGLLEAEDDADCCAPVTRQIEQAIERRGLCRQELDEAYSKVPALRFRV